MEIDKLFHCHPRLPVGTSANQASHDFQLALGCVGIQHLPKLQVVRAANNSLTALGACISRLSQLAELKVPGNCLSSLDSICGCTGLMIIGVARNIITSLQPLAHCNLLQVTLRGQRPALCAIHAVLLSFGER